jgi:predicted transcriptional regulator
VETADLAKNLEQIGLTDKEAKVYLALLSLESSTAYEIAQHCEVKKPTVYVILEDLRQKGLVLKVPHAKKALFAGKDINEYLAEQRGKLNAVQSMIPRLLSLGSTNKPKVFFYSGIRGMADALDYRFDSMRGKTYHSFYGNLVESEKKVVDLYDRWDNDAIDADISFKIVMPKTGAEQWKTGLTTLHQTHGERFNVRFLEEYSHPSNISIEIAEDFVRIDDAKFLTSTIIDDRATATAMRQIFEIVWAKGV